MMNRNGKRAAALLLAACLLLGLAACGSKDGGKTQQLTGKVYVPQFMDFKLDIDYIQGGCADEENVYIIGSKDEETEETDPDTGETYTTYTSRYGLYRIPLDGGEAAQLENYQMTQLPEGADGDVSIQKVEPGVDGTIWVTEYVYTYFFNLPEGMDMTSDERWDYQDYQESTVRRQLDSTGAEIQRIDVTDLAGALEVEYLNSSPGFDRAGNIYVCDETHLYVLDPQLNKLFTLDGENLWGEMTLLGDGTMGLLNYFNDEATGTSGYRMKAIDLENKGWGAEYPLPPNAYSAYPGGGDYLFYYMNNDSIYGYKAGAEDGEKIFSWIDSDINRNDVEFFSFLSDGRVVVVTMTRDWNDAEGTMSVDIELAVMTGVDRSELPEKKDLTFATMFLSYDMRNKIIDFNKTSQLYRINVKDYSEFNTASDDSAGLTRLNTEIVAGNVPDILDSGRQMPIRQYGAKGLLEDLWPYIENDADIGGRAGVMEHVLQCGEQGGRLYQIFPYFYIRTVVGAKSIVGDRMSWTLADLREALAKMPEGCSIFGQSDTQSGILEALMNMNADSFVDWTTGECGFDTDQFKAMLEFAGSFPAEFSWENIDPEEYEDDYKRILNGKQMLAQTSVSELGYGLQEYKGIFGGDISCVGYPREDGGVGSAFVSGGTSLSISSACKEKDAAWSFVRQLLLPVSDDEKQYSSGQFYVNKKDFDKSMADAMTPRYQEDENGNQVLDENGSPIEITMGSWWITDDVEIEIKTPTQADYDQLMALYNAVESVFYTDEKVLEIVSDEAAAYFAGDKGLDECAAQIQSRVKLYVNEQR